MPAVTAAAAEGEPERRSRSCSPVQLSAVSGNKASAFSKCKGVFGWAPRGSSSGTVHYCSVLFGAARSR